MTKGSICQEDITITCAPNNRAPRYMKQRLPEMIATDNSIIVELSIMNRTAKHKIDKEIEELRTLCTNLIYTEYYTPKQQNTHCSQMEYSPGKTIWKATKQVSRNFKRLKLY